MTSHPEILLTTFLSVSSVLWTSEVTCFSKPARPAGHRGSGDDTTVCHEDHMSAHIPKERFSHLPFAIYVQDEGGSFYQAAAIAPQCRYLISESERWLTFTAAYDGCFVREQEEFDSALTVVILTVTDEGRFRIIRSVSLTCERRMKEDITTDRQTLPGDPGQCSKDGFNIIISQNATVPPLNLDSVLISSHSRNCTPSTRSAGTVGFSFPFGDCGTQTEVTDENITYRVNIEAEHLLYEGSVFRDAPYRLTVSCSFSLARLSQLDMKILQEETENTAALKSEGVLRAELRFAKDSSYQDFYSSHSPTVELGQPVHVEVYVLKHKDEELELLLDDCWATPTQNSDDLRKWDLLIKGCPFDGDGHRTILLATVRRKELRYPSLHRWFVVRMFSFLKPPEFESQVYFHCNIELCKGAGCSQTCKNGWQRMGRMKPRQRRKRLDVVSSGPVIFIT